MIWNNPINQINQLHTQNEALANEIKQRQRAEMALRQANTTLSKLAIQLETSHQVGQQITSILDLNELLAAVVELIQTKFGYYFVGIWLLDKAQKTVTLQAGIGGEQAQPLTPNACIPLTNSNSIIVSVCHTEQSYLADDVKADAAHMAEDILSETRSVLALPLRVGQEMMGVLDIQSDRLARFADEDQQMLQTLTNQIAIAIRNAQLYKLEQKLRCMEEQRARDLTALNANKDKFFSIISHDLRSPFTALLGNAELMVDMIDELSQQNIREMSQSIYKGARAALNLMENLLTWSRLQQERIEYEPGPVELRQLTENTIDLLREMALSKQIQLEHTIAAGLFVYADEYMIDTVIRNLTANAIKFTPDGGQVTLSAQRNGKPELVEVSVTDTGVGINKEHIDTLFRIDVHHTTRGTANELGTGLGLILCQEMVKKNGGRIWIESKEGQGTTVKFTVPYTNFGRGTPPTKQANTEKVPIAIDHRG